MLFIRLVLYWTDAPGFSEKALKFRHLVSKCPATAHPVGVEALELVGEQAQLVIIKSLQFLLRS